MPYHRATERTRCAWYVHTRTYACTTIGHVYTTISKTRMNSTFLLSCTTQIHHIHNTYNNKIETVLTYALVIICERDSFPPHTLCKTDAQTTGNKTTCKAWADSKPWQVEPHKQHSSQTLDALQTNAVSAKHARDSEFV